MKNQCNKNPFLEWNHAKNSILYFVAAAIEKPNTQWLRRSFEQLTAQQPAFKTGLERCKTNAKNISLSTGNLLEKSEIPMKSPCPANRQPTEKLSSHQHQHQEPR